MRTPPGEATVGQLFVDEAGRVWRHISYSTQPTAGFERVDETAIPALQRLEGVIGSPLLAGLTLLVPEDEIPGGLAEASGL